MTAPRPDCQSGTARRLARHGWVWLRDPEARREERATATLVACILFFPIILGAIGCGIDVARNIWIRTSIQNSVDAAAVGGAGVTVVNEVTGVLEINEAGAVIEMRKLYALNRADQPGVLCIGGEAPLDGTDYTRCWEETDDPTFELDDDGHPTVKFFVNERSNNVFLPFLGIPTQSYHLEGKAVVNMATE